MSLLVRKATEQDLPSLQQLAKESFAITYRDTISQHLLAPYIEDHFSTEQLTKELSDEKNTFLLTCDSDKVTGYMKLRGGIVPDCVADKNALEIERIYTDPNLKGKGIGSTLITKAAAEAKEKGHTNIWLGVFQKNTSAVAFYKKQGFIIAGDAIFMMGGEEQNDYVMVKAI